MSFYPPPQYAQMAASTPASDPSLSAFNEVTSALRQLIPDSLFLYVAECKKLCLAILEASELTRTLQNRNEKFDGPALLHQEIQNQILGFALMKLMPDDDVKKALQVAGDRFNDGLSQNPPISRTGVMVQELESLAGSRFSEEQIKQELVNQPLFRLVNQTPGVLKALEQLYDKCADAMPQLLKSTNQTLMTLGTQKPAGPAIQQVPPPST